MFPFDPPENIRKTNVFRCFQGSQKSWEELGKKALKAYYGVFWSGVKNAYVQVFL